MGSFAHFTLAYAHDLTAVTDLDVVPCGATLLYACTPVPQQLPMAVEQCGMACAPPPVYGVPPPPHSSHSARRGAVEGPHDPPQDSAPFVGITVYVKTISGRKQSLGPIDPHVTTALHVKQMLRELEVREQNVVVLANRDVDPATYTSTISLRFFAHCL